MNTVGREIGFIGLGVMGSAMALNLVKAGHRVTVYNRTPGRLGDLAGFVYECKTATELGSRTELVLVSVSDDRALDEVLFAGGLADTLAPGSVVVDLSTVSPSIAELFARRLHEKGISFLDAPVTGGDVGARSGTLTIMAGGDAGVLDSIRPVLACLAKRVVHTGKSGTGQMTKAVNQVMVALSVISMTEGLHFAKCAGLDLQKTLDIVRGGAAGSWSLENYAPRVLAGDLAPGFAAQHMLKDLAIALREASRSGAELPGAKLAVELYGRLLEKSTANLGNHALIQEYESEFLEQI